MGSEQSSQANPSQASRMGQLKRGKSVPESKRPEQETIERPGSISPGPSVCSDSDLPYISYTVNRPIGGRPNLALYILSKLISLGRLCLIQMYWACVKSK